jgi:hypothetical protein
MTPSLDASRYFRYEYTDLPRGVRLHIISFNDTPSPLISVSVATGFGSTHLSCLDEEGKIKNFPVGMAHFMEHLLFWLHFDDVLIPMSYKYLRDPNAAVTFDRSIWGISSAGMMGSAALSTIEDEPRLADATGDIVRSFLSIFRADRSQSKIESLIAKTVSDVDHEIGHRHNLDYVLKLKLLSLLYRDDPVRFDILGTRETLSEISIEHINLALKVIRTNIQSVTVMGRGLSERFISDVQQSISQAIDEQPAEIVVRPIPPPVESLEVNEVSGGVVWGSNIDWSISLLGIKLPPLQQVTSSTEEIKRMLLINHLAMNHFRLGIGGILSPRAQAYFIGGNIEDPWFYWERFTLLRVMDGFKRELIQRFDTYREHFEAYLSGTFKRMMDNPRKVVKLCNAGDLYGYNLNEITDTFNSIGVEDFDKLIAELRNAGNNMSLAYLEI